MEEILTIVWAILCIILFFKIWSACNSIQRLADKYAPKDEKLKSGDFTPEAKDEVEEWIEGDK